MTMTERETYFNRKRLAVEALRLREVENLKYREIGLRIQPLTVRGGSSKCLAIRLVALGIRLRERGFIAGTVAKE